MPYCPNSELSNEGIPYETENYWEHVVADYLGCSFFDVLELCWVDFLAFRREAFIARLSESEKGQAYLRDAYNFENTKPDRKGLKALAEKIGR